MKEFHEFVSPNLKHKNGKVYYLNKYEMNLKNYNYEHENYYLLLDELIIKIDDIDIKLLISDNHDKIIIKFEYDDSSLEELNSMKKKINISLCNLEKYGELYNIDI